MDGPMLLDNGSLGVGVFVGWFESEWTSECSGFCNGRWFHRQGKPALCGVFSFVEAPPCVCNVKLLPLLALLYSEPVLKLLSTVVLQCNCGRTFFCEVLFLFSAVRDSP